MSFLSPGWFALLALAPLIVWLHMRRREPLEVPSTRLWRLVAEGERPEPRLRPPPPSWALALQLAGLTLLALALAQPRLAWNDRGPTTLIVDVGATMAVTDADGRSRLERALGDLAADETRRRNAPWSLWRVADGATPVVLASDDADAVRAALAATSATEVLPDWPAALDRIGPHLGEAGRVVIVTANAEAVRGALDARPERSWADAIVQDVGGGFANAAIASLEVVPDEERRGRWTLRASVSAADEGARPVDLIVAYRPDDADRELELTREPLRFSLAGVARAETSVDAVRPGILTVRIDGRDAYRPDDARSVRVDPDPMPPRVALLGPDAATGPLERALRALGAELVAPDADAIDLMVVAGAADPFEAAATPPAVLWFASAAGVDAPLELPARDAGIARWDAAHPLAAQVPWSRLDASAALTLPLPDDAEVVVEGLTGPLVAARTTRAGREAWFAFDPTDPAWHGSAAFLAALGEALAWTVPSERQVEACRVGSPCPVPRAVATGGGRVALDGATVAAWPDAEGPWPADVERGWVPARAGVASWHVDGRSGRIAVQPDPATAAAVTAAAGASAAPPPRPVGARWPELRTWVVVAALVVLVEIALAGWGRERFLRPDAWRAGGRLGRRRVALAVGSLAALAALVAAVASAPWPASLRSDHLVLVGGASNVPTGWPATRVTTLDPADAAGVVDVEVALEDAWAHAAAHDAGPIVWTSPTPPTRGRLAHVLADPGSAPVSAVVPHHDDVLDVRVERVELARPAFAGDVVDLVAVVSASVPTSARLTVRRDGEERHALDVDLPSGATLVRIPVRTPHGSDERWEVRASAAGDAVPGNDAVARYLDVRAAPRIWLVTDETDRGQRFAEALELQAFEVEVRPPFVLPVSVEGYAGVDAVVLANVPALEISTAQQEVLEAWVRDQGGALTITGGERSFGPGGYYETALDRVSPLSAKVPREAPEVSMLFVLDRSGSMQQRVGAATRLAIAKEATLTATELLGPASRVAIVVFDEQASVLLPWTSTEDLAPVEAALDDLVPGGGTALFPGLASARDLLQASESATRHVVLMTDGLSQPGDFTAVTREIVDLEATVSTVAIGQGADVARIREIAQIGGGAAHVTSDFRALPGILAQEAMLLSGDPVVRETVTPVRTGADPGSMEDLPARWPPLSAFVETTPKVDADVLLADASEGRALLASWRYGAGRVVAFGAHAVGPWSDAWTRTDAFPRWWSQWIRWTLQPTAAPGLVVDARTVGDAFEVRVEARDEEGALRTDARLQATWRPDDGTERSERLVERSTGAYVATIPVAQGEGTLEVRDLDGAAASVQTRRVHAYPARLAGIPPLRTPELARTTGGAVLDDAQALPGPTRSLAWGWSPGWRAWALTGLGLYLVTLASRYLPGWWRRRRTVRLSSPAGSATPTRSDRPLAG